MMKTMDLWHDLAVHAGEAETSFGNPKENGGTSEPGNQQQHSLNLSAHTPQPLCFNSNQNSDEIREII
jgi:hypothetical protein